MPGKQQNIPYYAGRKQLITRHFLYMKFFSCTFVVSAAEGIEPRAIRLKVQRLSAELSTSASLGFPLQ